MDKMIVAIQPKWLEMITQGRKKYEFRNWKVPKGTMVYFYESLGKRKKMSNWEENPTYFCWRTDDGDGFELPYITEGRGEIVATAIVKEVYYLANFTDETYNYFSFLEKENTQSMFSLKGLHKIGFDYQAYALELTDIQFIKPMDVSEFKKLNGEPLKKPPQSRVWVK